MSHLLFHDGQFYRDDKLIVGAGSRGLRYGDGIFETMKVNRDQLQLGEWHMERMFAALRLLEFDCPGYFTPGYLLDKILQLAHRNGHAHLGRVRLMVFRGNGGLHDPENHYPHHVIQTWALPEANHHWNENGLVIGIHGKAQKAADILANCKTNNYLPYIMGALEAKHQKWNDAILLNTNGRICDTTIANIFAVTDGKIITPSLPEGPVAGIMRRYLLDKMAENNIPFIDGALTSDTLLSADEIFLTNSTYGIRWVGSLNEKRLGKEFTRSLYEQFIRPLFLAG
ncbi:aminotransferase class IV [Flavihumibacter profundi]|uniref:aminotransferase class IV n=1 Tax=Flavihumibacter profundi TaxID=2716883 RepID=UPI001CC38DDD|nr:aminotransferase class IV [Flavihumibacter profundi]MBZ5857149.1 aminotransferase class IV [Flavihumibacter profundi]